MNQTTYIMKQNQTSDTTGLGRDYLSHTHSLKPKNTLRFIDTLSMATKGVLFALIFISLIFGQKLSMSGQIVNEKGKKFGKARIVLYNGKKQKVEEQSTSTNGKFKFKKLESGNYTLNVYGDGSFSAVEKVSLESNVSKLTIQPVKDVSQPQLSLDLQSGGVSLSWTSIPGAKGYKIYRNNEHIADPTGTTYFDEVQGGEVFSYTVSSVENNDIVGPRSLTEYGKALFPAPNSIQVSAKKNAVILSWEGIDGASAYNIYRDGELLTTTTDIAYDDFDLKFEKQYTYEISSVDWVKTEGPRSNQNQVKTHPELKALKKIKAEPGENSVVLNWEPHPLAKGYYIYQNGEKIDSTQSTSYTAKNRSRFRKLFQCYTKRHVWNRRPTNETRL